jgi:thioredoxin reductase
MTREVDVAVVGAGPAGLSAAVRVRWVKSRRAVPCSVVLLDPDPPGGLLRWGSCRLTGPGFRLPGAELIRRLTVDLERFAVAQVRERVDLVTREGGRWRLVGGERELCRARCVVLAPGLRPLANEVAFLGRGVALAYNGADYLEQAFAPLLRLDPPPQRILVAGNRHSLDVLRILSGSTPPGTELLPLLDEPASGALRTRFAAWEGNLLFGRLGRVLGEDRVRAAEIRDPDGATRTVPCQGIFIDYVAFERRPSCSIDVPGLKRDRHGRPCTDRSQGTNLEGIFVAGDVTGGLAMGIKALAEGAVAGFSAYSFVYREKFGLEPPLFAYAPPEADIDPERIDYPELIPSDRIELLVPPGDPGLKAALPAEIEVPWLAGGRSLGELAGRLGEAGARALAFALLDRKLITIQPQEEVPRGYACRAHLWRRGSG